MLLTVWVIFVSVLLLMSDVPGALGLRPYGVPDNEASDGRGTAAEESLAPEPGTQAGASVKML
jgi:hypothetical protein